MLPRSGNSPKKTSRHFKAAVPTVSKLNQSRVVKHAGRGPSNRERECLRDDRPQQQEVLTPHERCLWNPDTASWQIVRVVEQKLKGYAAKTERRHDSLAAVVEIKAAIRCGTGP